MRAPQSPKFMDLRFTAVATLVFVGNIHLAPSVQAAQATHPGFERETSQPRYAEFIPPDDANPDQDQASIPGGAQFKPPQDASPLTGPNIGSGGSRGSCLGPTETAFTAFGPSDPEYILGRTVSSHPTFVWYLPESETTVPVIFRLLAPDEDDIPAVIFTETLDYTPGFVTYQLPDTVPALSSGIGYRWQVILECNPLYPAQALVQEIAFEVVPETAALTQALASATTAAERASAYGQASIWYEAIAAVAQATTPADQQRRGELLTDLTAAIAPEMEQLRQDILDIVQATTPETTIDE